MVLLLYNEVEKLFSLNGQAINISGLWTRQPLWTLPALPLSGEAAGASA